MRILLAAEGTRGDVYPVLALAEACVRAGHEVRLCATPDFDAEARARGIRFHAVGRHAQDYLRDVASALTGGGIGLLREVTLYLREGIEFQMLALPDLARDADFVIGAGVQVGAASAAELHGLPYRYLSYCPVMFPSAEHAPFTIRFQALPGWANRVAWHLCQPPFNALVRRQLNRWRRTLGLPDVRDAFAHIVSERPILAADRDLAPCPGDCRFDVQQIRCLHPEDASPLPEKLEAFLEAGEPPVYVGFGSMPDPDPAATTRAILAAVEELGCRAVVSRGWAGLGEGPLPESVFPTGPVSHSRLFRRVSAVVHHGGAGTTTTAARAGVAQLVVPHVLDQFYWARRVERLGLGPPPLRRTQLDARRLADRLRSILDNEVVTDSARRMGERLEALGPIRPDLSTLLR